MQSLYPHFSLQIFLICLVGSAQASPDYLRMILSNYLSDSQDMETINPSDNLMDLRRDGFISYELKYRSRDPAGLHFRQEYSDGSGLIKGILNLKDEKGAEKIVNYSLEVKKVPDTSLQSSTLNFRDSLEKQISENQDQKISRSKNKEDSIVISKSAPRHISMTMNEEGEVIRHETVMPPDSFISQMNDSEILMALSSEIEHEDEKLPESSQFGDEELIMVFRYKPDIKNVMRSIENWGKGVFPHMNVQSLNQGDLLYESEKLDEEILENDKKLQNITPIIQDIHPKSRQNDEKDHNSLQHTTHKRPSVFYEEVQDDENFLDALSTTQIVHNLPEKHDEDEDKLLHTTHTRPDVKVFEMFMDFDGQLHKSNLKSEVPDLKNLRHRRFDDDDKEEDEKPLYETHTKPKVKISKGSGDDDKSRSFKNAFREASNDFESDESNGKMFLFRNSQQHFVEEPDEQI
ncbi:hypothetical protein CDAR_610571 [Caerostris darwini]|uniref:Uncharacterized protein n=1 Tax=Caerostris darwini TaxID=1538125 RepID=A0AAV4SEK4_9ARAC|nr:hypothetical protein CDAR_610571 [Caerostris darwini]